MLNIKRRDHVSNSIIYSMTDNHLYTVLGSDSWVFLGMSFVSLKKSLSEDMLSIYHHMAKGDLDVHVPPSYQSYIKRLLGYDEDDMSADQIATLA